MLDHITLERRAYQAVNPPAELAHRFSRPILVETYTSAGNIKGPQRLIAFRFIDPESGAEVRDGILTTYERMDELATMLANAVRLAEMHFHDLAIRADERAGRPLMRDAIDDATAILNQAFPEGLS